MDYLELKASEAGVKVGEIEDIKILGDNLLVKHRMSGKSSFLRFTKSGDFVIEIVGTKTSQIRNPEDVIAYKDGFAVLAENGIHTVSGDGKYMQHLVRNNMPGTRFFYDGGVFQVINEEDTDKPLVEFPSKNKSSKDVLNLPDAVQRKMYSAVELVGREGVHFYSVLSDSVFSYQVGSNIPVYAIKGDEMPTFAQLCSNLSGKDEKETLKYLRETEHVILRKYFENRDYVYLTYWVGSDPTTAILNKKSGDVRYFGFGVNDIDGGVWDEVIHLSDKNELYIPITAYKVGGHKISNKKAKGFDRLQLHIAASGNPVIMRCKLSL